MERFIGILVLLSTSDFVQGQCEFDCYTYKNYCMDQGKDISEDVRYECAPCSDICHASDDDSNEKPSSECVDYCSHYLWYRSFEKQNNGFLGKTLYGDISLVAIICITFSAVCVMVVLRIIEKCKLKKKYKHYTNVTELHRKEADIPNSVSISTVTQVQNHQFESNNDQPANGRAHGHQHGGRLDSETNMTLNSAGNGHAVLHAIPSDGDSDNSTQVLKS
ncbi:uncharacterized protein [Ptychodera flava]|uniref:uncharacterized protein n=1 Tax=Ptychodera flava TaxID=63121 RepID=UPI00396AA6BA